MLATLSRALRVLPALGSAVVGITALGAVAGGMYVQAYFERIHAAWAIDLVSSATLVRNGLVGAAALLICMSGVLALTLVKTPTQKSLWYALVGFLTPTTILLVIRETVSSAFLGRFAWWADLAITIGVAYSLSILATLAIGRRTPHAHLRRIPVLVAAAVAGIICIILPIARGNAEGRLALGATPSSLHPDICIKGDVRPWRLLRAFDAEMLIARVEHGAADHVQRVDRTLVTDIRSGTPKAACPTTP